MDDLVRISHFILLYTHSGSATVFDVVNDGGWRMENRIINGEGIVRMWNEKGNASLTMEPNLRDERVLHKCFTSVFS